MYRLLESEMVALHPMWNRADGLTEPVEEAFKRLIEDPQALVYVGEIDGVPLGFIVVRSEQLLPQAGERVASVRLLFTEEEAREVGVAGAMLEAAVDEMRGRGHTLFDAHVLPGHRLAKNFFEAAGFSARSIVMHHSEEATR